jgi:hypothetical protein
MINRKTIRIWIVVLYPYLSQYKLGETGLDIGTLLIALLTFKELDRLNRVEIKWFLFSLYCIVSTIISVSLGWMTEVSGITSAVRLGKMILAFLYVSLPKDDVDEYQLKRIYYKVGDFATFVIFAQLMLYYVAHLTIRFDNGIRIISPVTNRPTSIFGEPSQYTNFMLVLLAMTFFKDSNDIYHKDRKILYSVGILLSTSGQGYFILAGMWLVYVMYSGLLQHHFVKSLLTVLAVVVAVTIASRIPIIQESYARIYSSTSETGYSTAVTGRLAGFEYVNNLTKGQFLVGTGFGNRVSGIALSGGVIYYNGISSIVYGSGIIGLLLYVFICMDYMRKTSIAYTIAILAMWGLMFSANLFYAPYIILYFFVIKTSIATMKKETYEREESDIR